MTDAPIRIAIVDDHPVARCGMEGIFASRPGLQVTCAVASLAEFRARAAAADVAVLDLYLDHGRLSPAEIAAAVAACPALVVSASARRQDVLAAIRAGASGYLVKTSPVEAFAEAVRTIAAGGFYVSSQLADLLDTSAGGADGERIGLAPRERQALALIAQGFTQAQAATRMGISPATIDTYLKRIRRKLGPGNKAELTRRAIELGEVAEAACREP